MGTSLGHLPLAYFRSWKCPECQESVLLRNLGGVRITGRKPGKLEERLSAGRNVDLQYKGGINVVEGKIYK